MSEKKKKRTQAEVDGVYTDGGGEAGGLGFTKDWRGNGSNAFHVLL